MRTLCNTTQSNFASIKKQLSKIIYYFMAVILTFMFESCNKDLVVDITQLNEQSQTTYNTADCYYYGNIGSGNAFFILDLHDALTTNVGILIAGYATLPNNFANFKLDVGIYNPGTNGIAKTFFVAEKIAEGTMLYNYSTNKHTIISGGVFTVALSGNNYTIATNFTGKDANTGATVNDICIKFTGAINFINPEIENSTYTATGSPQRSNPPGASRWEGMIIPVESYNEKWYEISNWGNKDITVYLDEIDRKIVIDDYTRVKYDSTHDGYFRVAIIEGNTLYIDDRSEAAYVTYDAKTKKLIFPTKVTFLGKEYQALVGVIGYNRITNEPDVLLSDFYADVVLQLAPSTTRSSTVQESDNAAGMLNRDFIHQSISPVVNKKNARQNKIVTDLPDETGLQKMPLSDLKVTSISRIPPNL